MLTFVLNISIQIMFPITDRWHFLVLISFNFSCLPFLHHHFPFYNSSLTITSNGIPLLLFSRSVLPTYFYSHASEQPYISFLFSFRHWGIHFSILFFCENFVKNQLNVFTFYKPWQIRKTCNRKLHASNFPYLLQRTGFSQRFQSLKSGLNESAK